MSKIETYSFTGATQIEDHPDSPGVLTGWVTKFGLLSCDRGGYRDTFTASAFSNIETDDIRALQDHDWDVYLGRTSNQSLQLILSDEGLQYRLTLPDTQQGRDTAVLCRRKDITGCSFGYEKDTFTWVDGADMPVRQHTLGRLHEISVVFDPAFEGTSIELNSKSPATEDTLKSLEQYKLSKVEIKTASLNDLVGQMIRIAAI